ncbi:hypothetical protein [Streptomyces sp. NPDC048248]|uniref:hypothetical protein n=1 Tax=Streptomyces sp. NPDC048248 TaxID=3365523 RepID=UPI00371C9147
MRLALATSVVGVLTGVLAAAAPVALADSVAPGAVGPGDTVTVTVRCAPSGVVTSTISGNSQALAQGRFVLHRTGGTGDATYRGQAKIASRAAGGQYHIDGTCPDERTWSVKVNVKPRKQAESARPTTVTRPPNAAPRTHTGPVGDTVGPGSATLSDSANPALPPASYVV